MAQIGRPGPPNLIDKYIGSRVRVRRTELGMSQVSLAKALNLSFQQVQKYEKGVNRIGASRLQRIAQILEVPVAFFFDGAPVPKSLVNAHNLEVLTPSQSLFLIKTFLRIKNDTMRRLIMDLITQVADDEEAM